MDPIYWAVILLAVGLLLVLLEFLIPSGGILGVMAALAILSGIIMAFNERGPVVGMLFVGVTVVSIPGLLIAGFRILPHTPIGRQLISESPTGDEVISDMATRRNMREMIGWIGRSTSPMLPSGSIEVEGQTLDAVSQGMAINANTPVKIIDVQGTRIIVRPCREEELLAHSTRYQLPESLESASEPDREPAAKNLSPNEAFSQTLEELGLENWDEPLSGKKTDS
jgi:membrane-bound ClpP family serine protease